MEGWKLKWLNLSPGKVEDLDQTSRNLGLSCPFSCVYMGAGVGLVGETCLLFYPVVRPLCCSFFICQKKLAGGRITPLHSGSKNPPTLRHATHPSSPRPGPRIMMPWTDMVHLSRRRKVHRFYSDLLFFSSPPYLHSVRRWHILEHNLLFSFQESNCYFCVCER